MADFLEDIKEGKEYSFPAEVRFQWVLFLDVCIEDLSVISMEGTRTFSAFDETWVGREEPPLNFAELNSSPGTGC
eukprot:223918-Pyramimonas_sp.AAC.1